jgi:hypothetical protein
MTTLVVITDAPSLGLTVGNIVTDDQTVLTTYPQARLKASAYVAGLLTGNLRRCFVAQDPGTGTPVVPLASDLLTATIGQNIIRSSAGVGVTPAQLFSLLATYLTTNGYSVPTSTATVPSSGSSGTVSVSGTSSNVKNVLLVGADPGQDVDDAAAIVYYIQQHKAGNCILLAITVSPDNNYAAAVARILLDYAGLTSIPVAARQTGGVSQSDYFDASLASFYGYSQTKTAFPVPVPLLRQLLASSPDGSVVMSCTGPIPDVYDLIQSAGDGIDARTGTALMQAKVARIGMIVGDYTGAATANGANEYNLSFLPAQAKVVIDTLTALPIDVYCCDGNLGQNTFCGPLTTSNTASNPLKNAFSISQSNNPSPIVTQNGRLTRASWDLIVSDALINLGTNYTVDRGTMQFTTTNNASSWTRGAGNWCFLVPKSNTASLQAYYNPIMDAFDQGATAPAKPTFSVSEASQGTVVVAPSVSFFTSYDYTVDAGTTWTAIPTGSITTLSPATAYTMQIRGRRYGLTGPSSDAVSFTTKAVTAPTSIETVPGAIRHASFGVVASLTPNPPGTSRITAVTDTATAASPWKTDLGPAYVSPSYFGASRPALRSANGDANSSLPGAFGRVYNDLAELAGKKDWAIFLSAAIDADRNSGSRLISIVSGGGQDYQAGGCLVQVPTSARTTLQVAVGGSTILYGGSSPWTRYGPLVAALVCTNGSLQFRVNGVNVGSPVAMPAFGSAPRLEFLREAGEDGNCLFADILESAVLSSAPTTANLAYVEGKLAWNATGDGSLLPTGHPYKTVSP